MRELLVLREHTHSVAVWSCLLGLEVDLEGIVVSFALNHLERIDSVYLTVGIRINVECDVIYF